MRQPEAALQRAVMRYLAAVLPRDAVAFASANGGKRDRVTAAILKAQGVVPGVPDLCICWRGAAFFLELKAAKGRLSEAQRDFLARLDRAGVPNAVCRSLDDVAEFLVGRGLARRLAA